MKTKEEKEKLGLLLVYWIEHNKEHAQDFKRWAEKAKGFGEKRWKKIWIHFCRN